MRVRGTHKFDIQPTINGGDNFVAVKETTSNPTVNDDNTLGYYVGYKWVNTTTDTTYQCEDATTGAAVWTVPGGTDNNAIHDNVAGEITLITEKVTPVSADLLLIEDSADSNNKKRIQIGNLPSGTDADAIHDNVAGEINAITEKVTPVSADLIIIEDSADSNNKKKVQIGNLPAPVATWNPNDIPLGIILTSGASFFINGGAGIILSMSGTADDAWFFNKGLDNGGVAYDGSDLAIKLRCRLSQSGVGGDTVGLLLDYAFIGNGDNSTTTVTNVAQVNTDVSTEVVDIQFDLQMTTMTGGVVGDHTLMVSVTRNSTGAGADTFAGNFEIIGIELVKI